jgi:regulator of ribonuclease activity A
MSDIPSALPATADICDDRGADVAVLDNVFRSLGGRAAMAGIAVTLKLFEDNSLVRDAVAEDGTGKVLVIDAGGSRRRAVVGDRLAATAAANGWSGILVHGAVRDAAILATIDLAVHALGTDPRRTEKRGVGDRDVDVVFAGATIRPGDWVCADADGVLVTADPARSSPR